MDPSHRGLTSRRAVARHAEGVIELRTADAGRLFESAGASPLLERDLDARVEALVLAGSAGTPRRVPLLLLLHVDAEAGGDAARDMRDALHDFFRRRAEGARRRRGALLRQGRHSLLVGLVFLAACVAAGELLSALLDGRVGGVLREGLLIGGCVAMWRPLGILLYDGWPLLEEARLFDRLAMMPVRIEHDGPPDVP
jgi:hypothetical protein